MSSAMTPSKAIIITFVIRSTPFCRPRLQTKKPMTTTASIQPTISEGLASMVPKTPATPSGSSPTKVPVAIFAM